MDIIPCLRCCFLRSLLPLLLLAPALLASLLLLPILTILLLALRPILLRDRLLLFTMILWKFYTLFPLPFVVTVTCCVWCTPTLRLIIIAAALVSPLHLTRLAHKKPHIHILTYCIQHQASALIAYMHGWWQCRSDPGPGGKSIWQRWSLHNKYAV